MLAADHGGPTREFLSEVWRQLGEVPNGKKMGDSDDYKLFDNTRDVLIPQADALQVEAEQSPVECYYRVLGRIMLHSIGQRIPIAHHVLVSCLEL